MKKTWIQLSLTAGLLASGCGVAPDLTTRGAAADAPAGLVNLDDMVAVDYDLQPAGYAVASVSATGVPLAAGACVASSTRNNYFQASHVTDGNPSSAWAPAATDKAPTLTFRLNSPARLSGIKLKMSHVNATVDVEARVAGGPWRTVAAGLAPVPTTLSDLDVTACQADEVRLTFRGADLTDLLVCEAQLLGAPGAPLPSPAPSAMPTTAPSPMPSNVPSTVPLPQPPCTTSGGGWLPVEDARGAHKVSFGFVARSDGAECRGTVVVEDLTMHLRYVGLVEALACQGNLVTFTGHLESGAGFTATVVDESRHGKRDTFSFSSEDGALFCGYLAEANSHGGRVQIHRKEAVRLDDDREAEVDASEAEALGLQVVRSHERFEVSLDKLNAECLREGDHAEEAVGHGQHGRNRAEGRHGHDD